MGREYKKAIGWSTNLWQQGGKSHYFNGNENSLCGDYTMYCINDILRFTDNGERMCKDCYIRYLKLKKEGKLLRR